jgi:IS30 family transposase
MTQLSTSTSSNRVQELVRALTAKGLKPEQIAAEMEHRVSARTIYRWLKGEHHPQQNADVMALEKVVALHAA